jgi:hypothetical protein
MTFVYLIDGADGLAAINQALDDAGFQAAAVHAEGTSAPAGRSPLLTSSLIGRVPHDARWHENIAGLLEGQDTAGDR